MMSRRGLDPERMARLAECLDAGMNPGNYQFAVVADFDNVEDYLVYRDHPVHRDIIGKYVTPIMADRAAVQYEL